MPAVSAAASAASEVRFWGAWAERDRRWCELGQRIDWQQQPPDAPSVDMMAVQFELGRQLDSAMPELWSEWERRLRARSDPLSQAQAERLRLHRDPEQAAGSAARLRDLAERTGDAQIAGLWAQWACRHEVAECRVAGDLWRALAPASLRAFLLRSVHPWPADAELRDWLARIPMSTGTEDPTGAMVRRLFDDDGAIGPGLRRATRSTVLTELQAMLMGSEAAWLVKACGRRSIPTVYRSLCEPAAEHLWRELRGSLLDERLILAAVRAIPERQPHWQARARAAEARRQWLETEHVAKAIEDAVLAPACLTSSFVDDFLRLRFQLGEVGGIAAQMPKNPQAVKALSEAFRRRAKRSLLDLPPERAGS